jgi:hypothetical protein
MCNKNKKTLEEFLKTFPTSNYLERDPGLLKSAVRAYLDQKAGRHVTDEEIMEMLDKKNELIRDIFHLKRLL